MNIVLLKVVQMLFLSLPSLPPLLFSGGLALLEKAAAVSLHMTDSNDTSQFCALAVKETLELEKGGEGNKSYLGAASTMNFIKGH